MTTYDLITNKARIVNSTSIKVFPCAYRDPTITDNQKSASLTTEANLTNLVGCSNNIVLRYSIDTDGELHIIINGYYFIVDDYQLEGFGREYKYVGINCGTTTTTEPDKAYAHLKDVRVNPETTDEVLDVYFTGTADSYYFTGLVFSKESLKDDTTLKVTHEINLTDNVQFRVPDLLGTKDGIEYKSTLQADKTTANWVNLPNVEAKTLAVEKNLKAESISANPTTVPLKITSNTEISGGKTLSFEDTGKETSMTLNGNTGTILVGDSTQHTKIDCQNIEVYDDGIDKRTTITAAKVNTPEVVTPKLAVSSNDQNDATVDNSPIITLKHLFNYIYPTGSIFMTVDPELSTPKAMYEKFYESCVWTMWGAGKVPVGVMLGDADFGTLEKTGGGKTSVAKHYHTTSGSLGHEVTNSSISLLSDSDSMGTAYGLRENEGYCVAGVTSGKAATYVTNYKAENSSAKSLVKLDNLTLKAHTLSIDNEGIDNGNLQPYITCYMWKRRDKDWTTISKVTSEEEEGVVYYTYEFIYDKAGSATSVKFAYPKLGIWGTVSAPKKTGSQNTFTITDYALPAVPKEGDKIAICTE